VREYFDGITDVPVSIVVWDIPGTLKLGYPKITPVWDIPRRAMLGYPNFDRKGTFCRGGTFLKHEVPLKD